MASSPLNLRKKSFLFKEIQLIQQIIILCSLFTLTFALYEDQIGKFDWKQSYIGKLKFASFDTSTATKKIIVATEENVIAALNIKTGQIVWRRVLERGSAGQIHAFNHVEQELITVSGGAPAIVRYWNLATGHIVNEWPVAEQNPERVKDVKWFIKDGTLHHILPIYNSAIEITSYDAKTGEKLKIRKVSAPFVSQETECLLAAPLYVCLKGDNNLAMLFFIDLFKQQAQPESITVNSIFGVGVQGPYRISVVPGVSTAISISSDNKRRKRVLRLDKELLPLQKDIDENAYLFTAILKDKNIIMETKYNNKITEIVAADYDNIESDSENLMYINDDSIYKPALVAFSCTHPRDYNYCKYLLSSEDQSLTLVQQNKIVWSREESLANIVAAEIVELPMSDQEQAIETEFDQKESLDYDASWDVFSMFIRRLTSQANQVKIFIQGILGVSPSHSNQRADLVRDKFGLHKMIVTVTSEGKIFGIDSKTGERIWQQRISSVKNFKGLDKMILYIQRGSRHFPHPPQCALLAADRNTGNGVIFTFNPITGTVLDGLKKFNFKFKQTLLLHTVTETFLRSIVILDDSDNVHVYPESASSLVMTVSKNTYLFNVDKKTGLVSGYSLSSGSQENIKVNKVWEMSFSTKTQIITHVATKNPIEHVHSQGRVLGDRSVLYKYNNPNLVAIITQGVSSSQKNTINLYLLDAVSGSVVFSVVHKRAKGPVNIVHSENWVVYSYFNEKSRRTEMATLELYEGKVQSNTTVFSSLATTKLPIVERQAFIFPGMIESMRETITEKGITSKHILVALANGGILELPWMYLDPRRPINPELREEGVIPYLPELPIPMDAIINYNQSVYRVSGIHTSPSGLESTCLVFVHGLDLFYTQVAPSKTFDVLKEDFDYYLIVIVLTVLVISSCITKKLASQKIQKQAWK